MDKLVRVLRREPIVALVTLCLLNVFIVAAGTAVVLLTPKRELAVQPPAVAARQVVVPGGSGGGGGGGGGGVRGPAAAGTTGPLPSTGALITKLSGPLRSAGAPINAVVIDPVSRRVLYDQRSRLSLVPASTMKIITAAAALAALGPDHKLTTKVVRSAKGIVLVGGGDPTLASRPADDFPAYASLTDLAARTATALRASGTRRVRLDYDASLYDGPRTAPGWKPNYVPEGSVAPVTALAVDEGRARPNDCDEDATAPRAGDPPLAAAHRFAQALRRHGVQARVGAEVVAPKNARQLAAVQSPPLRALVEHTLECSDNDLAEALARQVAIARHLPADFAGASRAVHDVLAGLGVADGVQVSDGSGLSVSNRVTPAALARIIALAATGNHPELRAVITGMPVAGFSGTLRDRYTGDTTLVGAGAVRAKTGTLSNVSSLAGLAYDADGRLLAFAFMVNNVKSTSLARLALDQLASVLAGCGCRG
ncbi:MAG TPA: D-alanyl-D-alanine carboxypeptidase/D-alanyl-D-alanine-endopeptidase [Streptosporangiaceae bacterium]|nr:D-alanyl-D-alanine carboxypeptidase/D-alanyl-D-alanine-endopeptidase [Streptosporangiaceae bacterium]